jgi:hypothetical protein
LHCFASAARTAKHRHGLARARPDSPDFRPLHFATRTAAQTTRTFRCVPTDRKLADRRERACAARKSKIQRPRRSAYRPRPAIAREAAHGQDIGNNRESGQLSLRCSPKNFTVASAARICAKQSALTLKIRQWADTSSISLRAGHLTANPTPVAVQPPATPPDSRGVSINGRAQPRRARTNPRPRELDFGSAGGWHEGTADTTLLSDRRCGSRLRGWASALLPGSRTRDVICKAAPMPYPKGSPRHRVPDVSPRDNTPDGPVH